MIGIAILLSAVAAVVAIIKRGRLWRLVLAFLALAALTFVITIRYTSSCSEDFCGIGQALIGSAIAVGFSLAAVVCAFQPKRSK